MQVLFTLREIKGLVYCRIMGLLEKGKTREEIFSSIYNRNTWKGVESKSGIGSSKDITRSLLHQLEHTMMHYNIRTMIDAPCGDFNWMSEMRYRLDSYIGIDIVPQLIENNNANYGNEVRKFICADIVGTPVPTAQLILCRDGLVHLRLKDAKRALNNFKLSGNQYLLVTTFPKLKRNAMSFSGSWRPLNMEKSPFGFPKPLEMLLDCKGDDRSIVGDKKLGLWRIADLP
jgi:hypothetical protein